MKGGISTTPSSDDAENHNAVPSPAWTRSLVACMASLTLAAPRSSLAALPPPPLEEHREKELAPLDNDQRKGSRREGLGGVERV